MLAIRLEKFLAERRKPVTIQALVMMEKEAIPNSELMQTDRTLLNTGVQSRKSQPGLTTTTTPVYPA